MTTFGYDFTEASEGGDYVTLTEGRYVFEFVKVEKHESARGNPTAKVTLKVAAGNQAYIGGMVTQYWPTTGGGAFRFQDFLVAIGIKPKDKGKVNLASKYGALIGARVTLEAGKEPREDGSTIYFHKLSGIVSGKQYQDLLDAADDEEEEEEEDFEDEELEDEEELEDDEEEFDDDDEEEDDDDEEEEELTVELVKSIKNLGELREIANELDVSTRKPRGKDLTVAILRKRIVEYLESLDEEEDDDEEPF